MFYDSLCLVGAEYASTQASSRLAEAESQVRGVVMCHDIVNSVTLGED